MITRNPTVVIASGILLAALATLEKTADAADSMTTRPGGFLTESDRRAPGAVKSDWGGLVEKLCARAMDSPRRRCPVSVSGVPGPSDKVSAGLPHLRLDILLEEVRNVLVSGAGVDDSLTPIATFTIVSDAADVSFPPSGGTSVQVLAPPPGDTWQYGGAIFMGIIANGCLGPPATFDLTLDSSIYKDSNEEVLGEVHLVDSVQGHGYYNVAYTIRATDEAGNVSDFIFSGDADSYCTGQLDLDL
jgi:hypothetical protein